MAQCGHLAILSGGHFYLAGGWAPSPAPVRARGSLDTTQSEPLVAELDRFLAHLTLPGACHMQGPIPGPRHLKSTGTSSHIQEMTLLSE